MFLNLYRFLQDNSWSERLKQMYCFDMNHVLYNNVFVNILKNTEYTSVYMVGCEFQERQRL